MLRRGMRLVFSLAIVALAHACTSYNSPIWQWSELFDRIFATAPEVLKLIQPLTQSVQQSNDFVRPSRGFAYFAAKSYCDANLSDPETEHKKTILATIIRAEPRTLYENTVADRLRAIDVFTECKNPIRNFVSIEDDMLDKMDPYALLSLPKLALKLHDEVDVTCLNKLAHIKLTPNQLRKFQHYVLEPLYTPFVTPALLIRLILSDDPKKADFLQAASLTTKKVTAFTLQHASSSLFKFPSVANAYNAFYFSIEDFANKLLIDAENERIFDNLAVHFLQHYSTKRDDLVPVLNSLGSDGYTTVYDRALVQLLSGAVKSDATVYNLFQFHVSLPTSHQIECGGVRKPIYSLLYNESIDSGNFSNQNYSIYNNFDCKYYKGTAERYMVAYATVSRFARVYRNADGTPMLFDSEADCVGRHSMPSDRERSLMLHTFPCQCFVGNGRDFHQSLNRLTLFGQLDCINIAVESYNDKSGEPTSRLHIDSTISAYLNHMSKNYPKDKYAREGYNRVSCGAFLMHQAVSKLRDNKFYPTHLKDQLADQLDCFIPNTQTESLSINTKLLTCPALTRAMVA